jgi:regulation of enolase protein 1 (concanavalin A-like superfamily)
MKKYSMNWLNEPEDWEMSSEKIQMTVTPKTDFWRKNHYGFTVDDGPFLYCLRSGDFEVSVKISGNYKSRFDQMGLMLRSTDSEWIKTGVEFFEDKLHLSTVVTHAMSDWSFFPLSDVPDELWIKIIRRKETVQSFYSLNGKDYSAMRLTYLNARQALMVGMVAACPDGEGFEAVFDNFKISHLPDQERLFWLESSKS